MLIGTEVGHVKHGVGIEDAHHRDLVEVEALGYHLCSDKQVRASGTEVADDTFIGLTRAGSVKVHTADAGLGEDVAHLCLNLFGTIATGAQLAAPATGTDRGHLINGTTVMARQLAHGTMQRQ